MLSPEDLPPVPGLERGEVRYYETSELGWSVPFHARELTATIYVYPGSRQGMAHDSKLLAEEFRASLDELSRYATAHGYELVKLEKSPGGVDPGHLESSALHASFLLSGSERTGTHSMFSETILATAGDVFLKVRSTYSPDKPKRSGASINRLLDALRSAARLG